MKIKNFEKRRITSSQISDLDLDTQACRRCAVSRLAAINNASWRISKSPRVTLSFDHQIITAAHHPPFKRGILAIGYPSYTIYK